MNWFVYGRDLCHERVKFVFLRLTSTRKTFFIISKIVMGIYEVIDNFVDVSEIQKQNPL